MYYLRALQVRNILRVSAGLNFLKRGKNRRSISRPVRQSREARFATRDARQE